MENDITTIEPLVQSVSNSIKDETIRAGGNIMEVGLDKILNEGLLKDIPFCSTVISVLRQSISWDTFIVYADVIDRLLPKDEELLFISFPVNEEYMNDKSPNNRLDTYARLVSLGLMRESPRRETLRDIERVNKNLKHYERTDFGKKFAEIIKE
jgi:hypothetical protein